MIEVQNVEKRFGQALKGYSPELGVGTHSGGISGPPFGNRPEDTLPPALQRQLRLGRLEDASDDHERWLDDSRTAVDSTRSRSCTTLFTGAALAGLLLGVASSSAADCRFPSKGAGQVLTYTFEPTVNENATVLHVTLTFPGSPNGIDTIEVPTTWAGQTLRGVTNMRPSSSGTTISDGPRPDEHLVKHPNGQPVVLTYDLNKDWTGPLRHPMEFHAVLLPEYFEINGQNALVHPVFDETALVTTRFDWRGLPDRWVLATSFGIATTGTDRCQSHTGPWTDAHDALFAAGDFRIHNFQIGKRAAVLAVRGVWTFADDEAIADLQRVLSIVRDFWHDDRFPYFLVTLKAFDQDQGSSDGTALTNAFWLYLSRKDPFSAQLTTLAHETFHAWNPRKMGVQPAGVNIDWFREGVTRYYADLLVYRTGLLPLATYVNNTNADLRGYADSSNPYVLGRVMALWLDAQIREESRGRFSLDDVMFDMVKSADKPLSPNRILETTRRYASKATVEQLQRAMEGTQRLAPPAKLPLVGACVRASVDALPTFDLGFDIDASSAAGRVVGVQPNGPAFQGGLRDGQILTRTSYGNGQPDRPAQFTVGTDGGSRVIEYYPRGAPRTAFQFHLDATAIAGSRLGCGATPASARD